MVSSVSLDIINTILGHYAHFFDFLAGIFRGSQQEARGSRLEAPTRRLTEQLPPGPRTRARVIRVNFSEFLIKRKEI